ncbi:MAG: hypothetical protein IPF87_16000 [Gemmatimonadetes bacterium]|nr:hypothetical protein [Gemmatimonadota bacterium]
MPTLRYVVGSGEGVAMLVSASRSDVALLSPREGASVDRRVPFTFSWAVSVQAALYRVELRSESGAPVFSALVAAPLASYRTPPFLGDRLAEVTRLRWRVVATDASGREVARSAWRVVAVPVP